MNALNADTLRSIIAAAADLLRNQGHTAAAELAAALVPHSETIAKEAATAQR